MDVLSLGATKNGAFACEAVVFFDPALAADMAFRRKRSGHTLSKGRFLAAQMNAWLEGDHWLDLARTANARARELAQGLMRLSGVRVAYDAQVNEVFAILPASVDAALKAADVRLAKHLPPPSETNFGGGYLVGDLAELEAAAVAFVDAIRVIAARPLEALRRPDRLRR